MRTHAFTTSSRIEALRARMGAHLCPQDIPARDACYRQVFERAGNTGVTATAEAFASFLSQKRICLLEEDLLAGYLCCYTYNSTLPMRTGPEPGPNGRLRYQIDPEEEAAALARHYNWPKEDERSRLMGRFFLGMKAGQYKHFQSGHVIPGYNRVLAQGIGGLMAEGEKHLPAVKGPAKEQVAAMLRCLEAARDYILRYAALARRMAADASGAARRSQLLKIAAACNYISLGKPRTFFEAVQLLWLSHELIAVESPPSAVSFGRLDQYLYPFYLADLEAGRITPAGACELVDALWLKMAELPMGFQNVTLGGSRPDGSCGVNDLSYMCLSASYRLRFDQPLLSVRYTPDIPPDFWEAMLQLMGAGTGFPAIFNEAVCAQAKMRAGLSPADAADFAIVGCVELSGQGCELSNTETLRVNLPLVLERALNKGWCAGANAYLPVREGRALQDFTDFPAFYDWLSKEIVFTCKEGLQAVDWLDRLWGRCWPTPFLSATLRGCFATGKDATQGGTVYNNTPLNLCGMASLADSLAALRSLVFEQKKVTLADFTQALKQNYEGWAWLRELAQGCPKYGNHQAAADGLLAALLKDIGRGVQAFRPSRGGRVQLGLYTVEDHATMGRLTGALPDGRLAGTALSNGMGSVQGRDVSGPTALMQSALEAADHRMAANGLVLDIKFSQALFRGAACKGAFRHLLSVYFAQGGMELQCNVVDRETLLMAQKYPDQYASLLVRVSGFSAYFTTLSKTTQDEIIARYTHGAF